MRITFLCSCLEAGRDGVGDYTRLLVRECLALGLESNVIALHDSYITEPVEEMDAGGIPVLRLPATIPWSRRVELAAAFRSKAQPDWISLQFVPYGFNPKGIVWNLGRHLSDIVSGTRLHVMFHELWIGESWTASWKEKVIGRLQRASIMRLLRRLDPRLVVTSNTTYAEMLSTQGVKAQILALFGNIPVVQRNGHPPFLASGGSTSDWIPEGKSRDECWWVILFGTLHPEWEAEPLFSVIGRAASAVGRHVCFIAVGRLGMEGGRKWASMAERYRNSFSFLAMGEQTPAEVSAVLQAADFGIASSPWQLIEKSGSALAMLEHGLPVIVNRDDWQMRGGEAVGGTVEPLLHRLDDLLEDKLMAGLAKGEPRNRVHGVAEQFVRDLAAVANRDHN